MQVSLSKVEEVQQKLRQTIDLHQNHYALIENYVEKYVPLQIHTAMQTAVRTVAVDLLQATEGGRFAQVWEEFD
jgi:hypothetical protein